jgi:hypothetical protein
MSGDDDVGSGDDTVPDSEKQQDYDDVAHLVGQSTQVAELQAMIDAVGIAYVQTPAGFQSIGDNNIVGSHGALQFHYSWYCRDAVDQVDIACDGLENHVHMEIGITGDGGDLGGLDRTAKWTVRDVMVNEPRVDGPGHVAFSSDLPTGSYKLDFDDTYTRVRFLPTPTVPTMGAMDLDVVVHRTRSGVDRAFETMAHIDLTTKPASLVFDGVQSYRLDMSTGAVTIAR